MSKYEVRLGVVLDDDSLNDVKTRLKNIKNEIPEIKLGINDSDFFKEIKAIRKEIQNLANSKQNKIDLGIDMSDLKEQIEWAAQSIANMRDSIGFFDWDKSDMSSIVDSVNKISKSLDVAIGKFEELNTELKNLSSKDFGINLDIKLGGTNQIQNNMAYSNELKNNVIPQLKKQAEELTAWYNKKYTKSGQNPVGYEESLIQMLWKSRDTSMVGKVMDYWPKQFSKLEDRNTKHADQAKILTEYIDTFKKAANMSGVNVDNVISGTSADELMKNAEKIKSGTQQTEDSIEKLKNVFGGSNDDLLVISMNLESVVEDLGEIKKALTELSSGVSLEGLVSAFDRLSESIEKIISNAALIKTTLNDSLSGDSTQELVNKAQNVEKLTQDAKVDTSGAEQAGQKIGDAITKSAKKSLTIDEVIDEQVLNLMNKFNIAEEKGSKAFNEIRQALVDYNNEILNSDNPFDAESGDITKVTSALEKHMNVAKETENVYKDLAEYIKNVNNSGQKVNVPNEIKQEFGKEYARMRNQLGKAFTTGKGQDFESFIVELNGELGNVIDTTQNAQQQFEQLWKLVNKGREKGSHSIYDGMSDNEIAQAKEEMKRDVIRAEDSIEKKQFELAAASNSTTNIIIENEEKKQQAYKETADEAKKTSQQIKQSQNSVNDFYHGAINRVTSPSIGTNFVVNKVNDSDAFQSEMEDVVRKMTDSKGSLKSFDVYTRTSYDEDTKTNIEELYRAQVTYNNALGETIKKTIQWNQIGTDNEDNPLYGWVETDSKYSQSSSQAEKLEKQKKREVANLTNRIEKLNSKATDKNAPKSIQSEKHLEELEKKYNEITEAIKRMNNASDNNSFEDERIEVKKLISEYESLASKYKNMEKASTKDRSKDVKTETVKYDNELTVIENQMKAAGRNTEKFESELRSLRETLKKVTDTSGLHDFINQLDILKSKYKVAVSAESAVNKPSKNNADAFVLESQIKNLQEANSKFGEFEADINGTKISIKSLLDDLGKVKNAGDLSAVQSNFRAFKQAASDAGISIKELNQSKEKLAESIKLDMNAQDFDAEMQQIDDKFDKLLNKPDGLEEKIKEAKQELQAMKNAMTSEGEVADVNALVSAYEKYEQAVKSVKNQFKMNDGFEKEFSKEVTDAFREIEDAIKRINKLEIDLVKAEANNDLRTIDEINKELDRLRQKKEQLNQFYGGYFSDGQNKHLKSLQDSGKSQKEIESSKQSDIIDDKELKDTLSKLTKLKTQIENMRTDIGKLKLLDDKDNQIEELEKQLRQLERTYTDLENKTKDGSFMSLKMTDKDAENFAQNIKSAIQKAENELKEFEAKFSDTKAKTAKDIKVKFNVGDFAKDINRVDVAFNKLSKKPYELELGIEEVNKAFKKMEEAAGTGKEVADVEKLIKAYDEYSRALKKVKNQLDMRQKVEGADRGYIKDTNANQRLVDDRNVFVSKVDAWAAKNSAAVKKFGAQLEDLKARAQDCDRATLNHLEKELKQVDNAAEVAGVKMKSFGDRLKEGIARYASYFSVSEMFMYAEQAFRSMFEQVKLIDSAMTELKKVTDETDSSYNRFLSNAATRAKEIGTTIDGLVSSTSDFARLGYSFEDAQGLAEVANIYAVVGDEIEGVEGATESLISTMAAFKDEAKNMGNEDFAMSLIDKFNEIGNKFAISSGGIGEAMKRSASSLDAANNTIDESIALITAANTVVQDTDKVGNAFKTISMRIRGAVTELEEAGESTEGMAESTAKMRQEIMALSGVDIMLDKDIFKSTYDIMDELAKKWEDLTDIQQASIIELMAGKHQGNVFASLMANFDTAREALEVSANSSGSAMQEHAKWSESLEAKLLKLQAAWQSLSQSFLDSDFLKIGLNLIINLADGVNKLIDKFGLLAPAIGALFSFNGLKGNGLSFFKIIEDKASKTGKKMIASFIASSDAINKAWNRMGANTDTEFAGLLNKDTAALNSYAEALKRGVSASQAENECLKKASYAAREYAKGKDFAAIKVGEFEKQQKQARVSLEAGNKSFASAKAIIKEYNSGMKNSDKICKNTGLAQKDFNAAVASGNKNFGNYLTSLKGGRASMLGYAASLVKSKIASIGLQAVTMALNMGITMLVSAAISGIVKWLNKNKELAEQVEELTSKYREQHTELKKLKGSYDTSNEDSMISKFERLSRGVDATGKNVSLTASEFEEYQSIVDTIAGQIPSMVAGYDEQGNAILSCKGNVEELTEAYKNLIHAQNQQILINNSGDIEKAFENAMSNYEDYDFLEQFGNTWSLTWLFGHDSMELFDMKSNTAEALSNLVHATSSEEQEKALKEIKSWSWGDSKRVETIQALQKAGVKIDTYSNLGETIEEILKNEPDKIRNILDNHYAQFDDEILQYKTKATALLSDAFDVGGRIIGTDYSGMSEELQSIAHQTINSLDLNFLSNLRDSGGNIEQWTKEMLNELSSIDEFDGKKIETGFELLTQFNGGDISYGEYVDSLKDIDKVIGGLTLKDEAKKQLQISLGLDEKGFVKQYEELTKRLTDSKSYDFNVSEDEAKEILDGLSSEELSVAVDVITDLSHNDYREDAEEVAQSIERELIIRGLSLDVKIENVKTNIESLATALNESVSGTGLSSESITAIETMFKKINGYNPSRLFERTANGIRLNSTELNKLNSEYKKTNLSKIDKQMDSLGRVYNQTREELYRLTYGTKEYNKKASELDSIEEQINNLEKLSSEYRGLTSAYQEWQRTESASSQRNMYETIISGFETVKDELSRGWADDGTIEFLELITGKTGLASKSGQELKDIWDGLDNTIKNTTHSVRDFFTVDEDGNSTSMGVFNFLDAVGQLEEEKFNSKDIVKRDANNEIIGFDFQVVGGNKVIAEALGISEELVDIMVRASDDAGFVISMDGTYQQLDIVKQKAQEAANELKNTFKLTDYEFNLDTNDATGEGSIAEQYEKAFEIWEKFKKNKDEDGNIDMGVDGADEAYALISTLQTMVDRLSKPVYMEIDASQVEKEIKTPLSKLKEYEELLQTEHQLKLKDNDTSEIDEAQKEIVDYFEKLDEEIKIKLGIENLSREEIEARIEKGEIEIPASVDVQLDMSDDIKDMKLLMMNQLGLITDEEVRLKIGYEIDDSLVDTLNKDEKEVVVNFISKNEEWFNSLSEEKKEVVVEIVSENKDWYNALSDKEKEVVVNLVASGVDIESLINEDTKKILIDFTTNNKEIFDKLDEKEKKIFVEYIEKNKDVWKDLSEDDKKILVNLVASGVDLETLTNKEKKEVIIDFVSENDDEFNALKDEEKKFVVDIVTDDNALKSLEDYHVEIEAFAKIFGVEEVDDLKKRLDSLDDESILVVTEVIGKIDVDKLKEAMSDLEDEDVKVIAKAIGKGDIESLRDAIFNLEDKEIEAIAKAFGYEDVDGLKKAMDNLTDKDVQAIATTLGITDVNSLEDAIDRLDDKSVEAIAKVTGEDDVNNLQSAISNLKGKNVTIWAQIKQKASNLWSKITGGSDVNGTANVNGTAYGRAFAQGNWGTKESGNALVGELGTETLVRDGRYYTIGDNGAEFIKYKKGDIIFNHKQTEELFKNGRVTSGGGRGRALASGTAFSIGSGNGLKPDKENYNAGESPSNNSSGNNNSYNSNSDDDNSNSNSNTEKEFKEIIDWVEVILDRVQRAIKKFEKQANNIYKQWSTRNKALQDQIEEVSNEIMLQQQAYDRYMQEANNVGLDEKYASQVRNGTIDIGDITDEDLKTKIDDYKTWYEKALACKETIEDLKITESELYSQRFDNAQTEYDGILQGFDHTENMLNEYISQAEARGNIVSKEYYKALTDNEEDRIDALKEKQSALIAARDEAVASGKIEEGSEEWYNMCAEIDATTQAIEEGETSLLSYAKTMREIDWSNFDLLQEKISAVTEESDFLIDLMSNKKLYEDDGKLTSEGLATMGLHAQNYNTHMYQADSYGEEVDRLDKEIEKDPYNQDLINRRNELIKLQRESILAAEDEKESIRGMVEEGISLELDALQELIDKKNEALQSEKDLYEYQKKVKEQTEEIASLEKQMAAYEGDDSEEAKQKIQQIKVDLENAKEELQETEWDKYISDTSALLDNLYLEYETILNTRLDNIDALLNSVIATINGVETALGEGGTIATALGALSAEGAIPIAISDSATSIGTTLKTEVGAVGTALSGEMNSIWSGEGNAKSVLTTYGEDFKTKNTTLNTTLNGIKISIDKMIEDLDKDSKDKVDEPKTSPSTVKDPTKKETPKKTNPPKKITTGDGKPKVGDKVKFVSGNYYYDSQGKKPIGSQHQGKEVYITSINTASWATHPYHISTGSKLGKGDLGWLKLNQISGYATGKKDFLDDEVAWTQENGREFIVRPSDGAILTPIARGDSVLNASASRNIWDMANNPAEFIKDNLSLGSANIPSNSTSQNNYTQNLDKVIFNLPNVKNYNELISTMQKDKNFEKLILSMSVDRLAGRSSLAKNKSIR